MPDPVSRLQFAHEEIDCVFGQDFAARANPQVVSAVMISAAFDWAAHDDRGRAGDGGRGGAAQQRSGPGAGARFAAAMSGVRPTRIGR